MKTLESFSKENLLLLHDNKLLEPLLKAEYVKELTNSITNTIKWYLNRLNYNQSNRRLQW